MARTGHHIEWCRLLSDLPARLSVQYFIRLHQYLWALKNDIKPSEHSNAFRRSGRLLCEESTRQLCPGVDLREEVHEDWGMSVMASPENLPTGLLGMEEAGWKKKRGISVLWFGAHSYRIPSAWGSSVETRLKQCLQIGSELQTLRMLRLC